MKTDNTARNLNYTHERYRKCIHLCSLSIPIVYSMTDKEFALWVLVPLMVIFVGTDLLMKVVPCLRQLVLTVFGSIMRPHELKNEIVLNGASWVLISAVFCVGFLPKIAAVTGFTVLIISDSCAALFGRIYGRHKWFKTKSLEGSTAFVVSGLISVYAIGLLIDAPWAYYVAITPATIVAGFVEAVSGVLKIDDNLSIPISLALMLLLNDVILAQYWGVEILSLMK